MFDGGVVVQGLRDGPTAGSLAHSLGPEPTTRLPAACICDKRLSSEIEAAAKLSPMSRNVGRLPCYRPKNAVEFMQLCADSPLQTDVHASRSK